MRQFLLALPCLVVLTLSTGCGSSEQEARAAFDSLFAAKRSEVADYLKQHHPQMLGLNATKQVFWSDDKLIGGIEYGATSPSGEQLIATYGYVWDGKDWRFESKSALGACLHNVSGAPFWAGPKQLPEVDAIIQSEPGE